jgi:hypothetical protein
MRRAVRSPRGVAGAAAFLLALPIAALCQLVAGGGGATVIHVVLALGAGLMAVAVFDFRTARWIAWMGCLAAGGLAVTFLLQAVSELTRNAAVTHVAYQVLGQRLETWGGDLFLLWCVAVLVFDTRGATRIVGWVAMAIVAGVSLGGLLGADAAGLKVVYLMPFVWLLLEATKTPHPQPSVAVP